MANDKLEATKHRGIFRRKGDRRWIIKTSAKCSKTDKLVQIKHTLPEGATEAEAIAALAKAKEAARNGGTLNPVTSSIPTVGVYAPQWMMRRVSRDKWNIEGGTSNVVKNRLENHILPFFGDYLLDRVNYSDIQTWLDGMISKKNAKNKTKCLAASMVGVCYSHLKCLIVDGRKDYNLPPLPDFPEAPKYQGTKSKKVITWESIAQETDRAFTAQQLDTFLRAAEEISPQWYGIAVLGFGSDARFSEIVACEAHDFDLTGNPGVWLDRRHVILGEHRVAPGTKNHAEGEIKLLDAITTERLKPYLDGKIGGAMVFPPWGGAEFLAPQSFQKFLDRVSKATGLPRVTSKVMRRTHITLTHLHAMADALTQAQAGHSKPEMTMTYVKPSLEARKEHARKMGDVLYLPKKDGTSKDGE